jgi:nucleoside-diphosphate-sugar epimerase
MTTQAEDSRRVALVLGATGATGRLLVEQLLKRGMRVRVLVRSPERLPESLRQHDAVTVVTGSPLELPQEEFEQLVQGCGAVASSLGHNLSFKGIFGSPRRLVRDATRRVCEVLRSVGEAEPARFVLMNTAGNRNRDLEEPVSFAQKLVLGLLRALVPPHADNEEAADYLRLEVGQKDPAVQWVAVRPDGLVDEADVTPHDVHPSPTRSAIFNAGKTSRINVASFMASLIADDAIWQRWRGQMPVIYNRTNPASTD